jgi:hypothetical protein
MFATLSRHNDQHTLFPEVHPYIIFRACQQPSFIDFSIPLSRARERALSRLLLLLRSPPVVSELSLSLIGTDRWLSEPPCVRQGVPHGQTESGGIVLAVVCWSPCAQRRCYPTGPGHLRPESFYAAHRPEAVLPDRALCLPTFGHFLIVKKTSLSPSLSLPLSLFLTPFLSLSLSLSLALSHE